MTSGPCFVPPPEHLFRRKNRVDAGVLAVFGAVAALVFLLLLVRMMSA